MNERLKNFEFMKHRKIYYIVCVVLIVGSIGVGLLRGYNLGIDFTGGTMMEIEMGESEILVGRDVRRCALIMTEPGVDNVHCMIRFNSESNDYGIVDISSTATCIFRNNDVDGEAVPLQKGVMCTVERGSWIAVGDRDNLLQLL